MSSIFKPQEGRQTEFLQSSADIVIYGGSAGGGKSYALLLEGVRHYNNKDYVGIIFRRNGTQLRDGGLWTESQDIYTHIKGARASEQAMTWKFESGGLLKMSHLQLDKSIYDHQGKQYAMIGFDELTHFTESQFFYLLSRNRSKACKPYVRATCNPDADSWVAKLLEWWIGDDGFAIPERSGTIRYIYRSEGVIHWGDTQEELIDKFEAEIRSIYPEDYEEPFEVFAKYMIKSFTFISASVFDNKILMKNNPDYLASLQSQNKVERERLLKGNWKIKPSGGMYFKESYFDFYPALPNNIVQYVRSWDLASSEPTPEYPDPDATCGVLMAIDEEKYVYIVDMIWMRETPSKVKKMIVNTAIREKEKYGSKLTTTIPQDPGQAGKSQVKDFKKSLMGHNIKAIHPTGDKITRASPFSVQAEVGNVRIITGDWNEQFLKELEGFPEITHDDIVDACSDAFNEITLEKKKEFKVFG